MRRLKERLQQKKLIFVVSLVLLALISCGKKANPMPKGLPVPRPIGDLRGDAKDGVLFVSFSIPTRNKDGTEVKGMEGFRVLKSCGGCGGGLEPWKDIRLTDTQGYTIRDGRLYTYDNDLLPGYDYSYRVFPYTTKGIQTDGSNLFAIKWQQPPPPPKGVAAKGGDSQITLSWSREIDTRYNVYRFDTNVYPLFPVNPSPLDGGQLTDSNLQNGREYRYEVRAVMVQGGVAYEGEGTPVTAAPKDMSPPAIPKELKLEKKGTSVYLSWAPDTEDDLAGYNVYRVVAGKAEKVNKGIVKEPHYLDEKPGEERYISYYVTALDTSGNESAPSREQIIVLKE